jgi:hypothetical protein
MKKDDLARLWGIFGDFGGITGFLGLSFALGLKNTDN